MYTHPSTLFVSRAGILKLAALIFAFLLAVFLAFQLLEINMDFTLSNVIGECHSLIKVAAVQRSARGLRKYGIELKVYCVVVVVATENVLF